MTSSVKKQILFEIVAAGVIFAAYCANRYYRLFDGFIPLSFARFHFGDLCGGALFPAYANLIALAVAKNPLISSFRRVVALEFVCSVAWEVIAPLVLARSTGDLLDVLAYFCGGLTYLMFRHLFGKKTNWFK